MEYLLSEKEYQELKAIQERELAINKKELQDLCIKIACAMPVIIPWSSTPRMPKVWGCIIEGSLLSAGYCDLCPVKKICPYEYKEFSK